MSYIALYRKYRPQNLDDVVGQDGIIKTIKNSILNNKMSHAYLFSGPRGTGKTSTAKILAKLVNCENQKNGKACGKCNSCVNILNSNDIVEIDAASNNGVDEIRELRDKINLVPSLSKYKVYIIDEVHMLTTQAFNALLKTLEEPPSHAIFILATTEPYKIPMTVLSRCQRFQFCKLDSSCLIKRLEYIVQEEKIEITNEALAEVARIADGGMRDAINILDQLISFKCDKIELKDVYQVNGIVSYVKLANLLINIKNNNSKEIFDFVEEIDYEGKSISKFIEELIIFLKDVLVYINSKKNTDLSDKNEKIKIISDLYKEDEIYELIMILNETLINIKNSNHPSILFTISILKYMKKSYSFDKIEQKEDTFKNEKIEINDDNIDSDKEKNSNKKITYEKRKTILENNEKAIRINNTFATASKNKLVEIKNSWNIIKQYLTDKTYAQEAGILNDAVVVAAGSDNLILTSKVNSIIERINENIDNVEKLIKKIYNHKYIIVALTDIEWTKEKEEYINKNKQGYKYELITKEPKYEKKQDKNNNPVDQLMDLLGEELIEYK